MPSDVENQFRAELHAQADIIGPQIQGLENLLLLPLSPETKDTINKVIAERQRRMNAIKGTLAAMDVLDATGYPDLSDVGVPQSQLDDMDREIKETLAGRSVFQPAAPPQPGAATAQVNYPDPTLKPGAGP
jgi:hypothetical protein